MTRSWQTRAPTTSPGAEHPQARTASSLSSRTRGRAGRVHGGRHGRPASAPRAATPFWLIPDRSIPFGKYWRSKPLVFSRSRRASSSRRRSPGSTATLARLGKREGTPTPDEVESTGSLRLSRRSRVRRQAGTKGASPMSAIWNSLLDWVRQLRSFTRHGPRAT